MAPAMNGSMSPSNSMRIVFLAWGRLPSGVFGPSPLARKNQSRFRDVRSVAQARVATTPASNGNARFFPHPAFGQVSSQRFAHEDGSGTKFIGADTSQVLRPGGAVRES